MAAQIGSPTLESSALMIVWSLIWSLATGCTRHQNRDNHRYRSTNSLVVGLVTSPQCQLELQLAHLRPPNSLDSPLHLFSGTLPWLTDSFRCARALTERDFPCGSHRTGP